jgi:radical SAM-linked protein
VVSTSVQRWRLTFRRAVADPSQTHQALAADWASRLAATGLPFAGANPDQSIGPPRLTFAAPLPVGMAAERELVDLELSERRRIGEVRDAVAGALPPAIELVDLHDVWIGEPSLAGRARRAEYRVTVESDAPPAELKAACGRLLAASSVIRQREKGGRTVDFDLRPLVVDIRVGEPGPPVVLDVTTAFDPERGVGRPEDVIAAIAGLLRAGGTTVAVASVERRRIVLAGED